MIGQRRSRWFFRASVATVLLVAGMLLTTAEAATAQPVQHYSGAAPGDITCGLSLNLKFSPPLSQAGGGTTYSLIRGTIVARTCTPTNSDVTITRAKVYGSFNGIPLSCAGGVLTANDVEASLTVKWTGQYNGTLNGQTWTGAATYDASVINYSGESLETNSAGRVGFSFPDSGGTSPLNSGSSFDDLNNGSSTAYAYATARYDTMPGLSALCTTKAEGGKGNGIKSITLPTGSITIGT